jgi:peptidoglycan/xylan/chitin deacetylase (PgdA/CDA1 family)
VKKALLKTFYHLGAFAPFNRTTRGKLLILTYHRFSREKNQSKTSADEFAAHLAYLKKHKRVLSLLEAAALLENGNSLPDGATVITIDDGYQDAYDVAFPLLKKFGFPATLFAVTDFLDRKLWLWTDLMRFVLTETKKDFLNVEFERGIKIEVELTDFRQRLAAASRVNSRLKTMPNEEKELKINAIADILAVKIPALPTTEYAPVSWAQAREMDASNLRVESHTVTHPILTNINQTQLDYELQKSKARLENELNRTVETFCYPNGSLNETVWQSVKNNGYKAAVTTAYGFNEPGANQFLLNRIDAQAPIENFAQSVSGFESLKQIN